MCLPLLQLLDGSERRAEPALLAQASPENADFRFLYPVRVKTQ